MAQRRNIRIRRAPAIDLVEVRQHPLSRPDQPLWRAIVTTSRGYCYCTTYAGDDQPSGEKIRQAWADDHNSFDPYNG